MHAVGTFRIKELILSGTSTTFLTGDNCRSLQGILAEDTRLYSRRPVALTLTKVATTLTVSCSRTKKVSNSEHAFP